MELDAAAFVGEQALIEALKDHSAPVDCEQDRVLFRQDEPATGMYIVHNGSVSLTMRSPDGDVVMEILAHRGSLLGLPALVGGEAYSLSATARKGAKISFVDRDRFSTLMLSEPAVAVMILRVLAAEVRNARFAAVNT